MRKRSRRTKGQTESQKQRLERLRRISVQLSHFLFPSCKLKVLATVLYLYFIWCMLWFLDLKKLAGLEHYDFLQMCSFADSKKHTWQTRTQRDVPYQKGNVNKTTSRCLSLQVRIAKMWTIAIPGKGMENKNKTKQKNGTLIHCWEYKITTTQKSLGVGIVA